MWKEITDRDDALLLHEARLLWFIWSDLMPMSNISETPSVWTSECFMSIYEGQFAEYFKTFINVEA